MTVMQHRRQISHARILDAAAEALHRSGYAGVGVASVMKEAGLTHGGFYAHFASREAMLAAAFEHAWARSEEAMRTKIQTRVAQGQRPLRALVEEYLSSQHAATLDGGCPVAALAGEMPRQDPALRDVSAQCMRKLVALVGDNLPADSPNGAAFCVASMLIGALQTARALDGDERQEVLRACRDSVLTQYDQAGRSA